MSEEEKNLGVELIEKAIDTIVGTVLEVDKAYKDKKISTGEIIGLADNAFSIAKQGLNWKNILAQCKDVDSDEARQLVEYIEGKGIMPAKAADILNHTVALVDKLIDAYNEDVIPIIEDIKELKK